MIRKILVLVVLLTAVFFNGDVLSQQLRITENLRQQPVLLPMTTPDRNVMAAVDSYLFFEDGGELGVFIYYDDPRTKRDIDYIEFYDTDGNLLIVTWIDHLGICHVALDQGLLNEEDPAVDGTLILVDVGVGI
ncbi:MAG TPA: hypothetical protein VIE90_09285 [Candidatus Binatia bacterium]|jgi:hypothetical protein